MGMVEISGYDTSCNQVKPLQQVGVNLLQLLQVPNPGKIRIPQIFRQAFRCVFVQGFELRGPSLVALIKALDLTSVELTELAIDVGRRLKAFGVIMKVEGCTGSHFPKYCLRGCTGLRSRCSSRGKNVLLGLMW